jgi:hypothetical protein
MVARYAGVLEHWNKEGNWGYIKYWCPEAGAERTIQIKSKDFRHDIVEGIREGLWLEFNLHREDNHLPLATNICTRPKIGPRDRLKDFNTVAFRTRTPRLPPSHQLNGPPHYPGYGWGQGDIWDEDDWDNYCVLRRGGGKPDFTPELLDRKEAETLFDGKEKQE